MSLEVVINTPLQRGARELQQDLNRFNGLRGMRETVETVPVFSVWRNTPLKRGVNARPFRLHVSLSESSWLRLEHHLQEPGFFSVEPLEPSRAFGERRHGA